MSGIIAVGEETNELWLVKNALYRPFMNHVIERLADRPDLQERVRMAKLFYGISLHTLATEDLADALELSHHLRLVANKISHDEIHLDGKPSTELLRLHFALLIDLLAGFETKLRSAG